MVEKEYKLAKPISTGYPFRPLYEEELFIEAVKAERARRNKMLSKLEGHLSDFVGIACEGCREDCNKCSFGQALKTSRRVLEIG